MGDRLLSYYQFVGEIAGLEGRMKLAMITKIPSTKAALAPDSPENVAKFKEAVKQTVGKEPPEG